MPADDYLDRFPPEAREHAQRAYEDGFHDGAQSVQDELAEAPAPLPPPPAGRGRYLVRIMLTRGDSCEADTDPDAPPDAKPTELVMGMAAIAKWVAETVFAFHASRHDMTPDLDPAAVAKRTAGLRVSLSRAKGDTWWHTKYNVGAAQWVAAAHVVSVGK